MDLRIGLAVIAVLAVVLLVTGVIGPALTVLVLVACAVLAFAVLPRYGRR